MSDTRSPAVPPSGSNPTAAPATEEAAIGLQAPGRALDKIPRKFGRYRLLDCLGRGGMGAVFRAHDTQLDRTVALKIPFLSADDAETRQRFYREARAAANVHHANICPLFDVGEFQDIPYLTMAFIEGRSLARAIEEGSGLTPQQSAILVRKVALAMQEAHARGVIHRDVKPANILLQPNGEPVVMDFGLARRNDDRQSEGLTRQGDVIGTLEYMSPEQLEGDNAAVGPAADIYALGVVLYELLAGRRPFLGNTTAKLAAILLKPPPRPSEVRAGVPDRLEEICLKAMARQVQDRYPTMAQFAAALTEYLRSPRPAATSSPAQPSPAASGAGGRAAGSGAAPAPPVAPPVPAPDTKPVKDEATAPPPPRTPKPAPAIAEAAPAPVPASGRQQARSSRRRKKEKPKEKSHQTLIIAGVVSAVALIGVAVLIAVLASSGDNGTADSNTPPPTSPPPGPPTKFGPPPPGDGKTDGKQPPVGKKGNEKPNDKKQPNPPPPKPVLAVRGQPDNVALAVGERKTVTLKVERKNLPGPVTLRIAAPKGVRVTPAGPLTIQPDAADPVLTLFLTTEPPTGSQLEVTATPASGSQLQPVTARLPLRVNPGPCVRVVEFPDRTGVLAFTPDASLALVATQPQDTPKGGGKPPDDANSVRVWNLDRGEPIGLLSGHTGPVIGLSLSADGKTALSVSADDTVALWDIARGQRITQSPKQARRLLTAALSPDAKRALAVYPGLALQVDLEKARPLGQAVNTAALTGSTADDAIRTAAISGKHGLIGGPEGKLFLLDLTDKTKPRPLAAHNEAVRCAAFTPDGTLAVTGGGGVLQAGSLQPGKENLVCVWDVGTGSLKWKADTHAHPVVAVAFSSNGWFLATASADGEVRVWTVEDGKPVATFKGHTGRVLDLAFSPDGKLLWSGASDRTMRMWRLP